MAHISNLGAGMFSDLSLAMAATDLTLATVPTTEAALKALFASEIASSGGVKAANTFVRCANVREFPDIGIPPNLVKVPTFGSKTSRQVQGQADLPDFQFTINLVMTDWAKGTLLGDSVGSGKIFVARFALLNSEPTAAGATKYASVVGGLGTVENSQWYFGCKVESFQVKPSLNDSNTAVVALSIQTDMYGGFTV